MNPEQQLSNPASNTSPETETVPQSWPGGLGIYKYSKNAVRQNTGAILVLWVIAGLLGGGFGYFDQNNTLITIGLIAGLLSVLFSYGLTIATLKVVDQQETSARSALSAASKIYFKSLFSTIVMYILLGLSLLALIVPFFFVLPRLTLYKMFMVDQNLGPIEAIKASWNQTKGHSGKVWSVIGTEILYSILFITIIGIPFALYLLFHYSANNAVIYRMIMKENGTPATQPVTPQFTNPIS